jgi:hypothetical protein
MKMKLLLVALGAVLVGAGCVQTVNDRSTAGVPFAKDTVEGRYERPVDQVYQAAMDVMKSSGTLVNETILHNPTNTVKTVEGKINQRRVWVRVEPVDPKITAVMVQARTKGGGTDIQLAHEVEKDIAVKLSTVR